MTTTNSDKKITPFIPGVFYRRRPCPDGSLPTFIGRHDYTKANANTVTIGSWTENKPWMFVETIYFGNFYNARSLEKFICDDGVFYIEIYTNTKTKPIIEHHFDRVI